MHGGSIWFPTFPKRRVLKAHGFNTCYYLSVMDRAYDLRVSGIWWPDNFTVIYSFVLFDFGVFGDSMNVPSLYLLPPTGCDLKSLSHLQAAFKHS